MNPSFNIVDEAWIPVMYGDGSQREVGLAAIFDQAEQIADLAVLPHERVALMRLLLCLCYASQEEDPTREDLRPNVAAYLKTWHERFWLHHEKFPFLQLVNIEPAKDGDKTTPFSKLDFTLASGNNSMLFDHVGEASSPGPARLCLNLLTWQCFSPGGTISELKWNGISTKWKSTSAEDAPCVVESMLHVFIRGKNLLETLLLNYVPKAVLRGNDPEKPRDIGRPIWENIPVDKDDVPAVINATTTFVGRLVPLSRAVLLQEHSILHAEALIYPGLEEGFVEPGATVELKEKKNGLHYLSCKPDKAVWRELPALLAAVRGTGNERERGPLAMQALVNTSGWEYELVAVELAHKQAKILDTMESVYPLRSGLLDEYGLQDYEYGVAAAEDKSRQLGNAVRVFLRKLNVEKDESRFFQAQMVYWTRIEQELATLFALADSKTEEEYNALFERWKRMLHATAVDAYELVCGGQAGRYEQAWVMGRMCLKRKEAKQ